MLMIRLQRVGRKNDPSFRVVVTDSKNSTKSGKFLEVVGSYDARLGKNKTILKAERIKHWISVGAQLTDTVKNLLISKKIIEGKKTDYRPKPKPVEPVAEVKEEAAPVVEEKVEEVAPEVVEETKEEAVAEESVAEPVAETV